MKKNQQHRYAEPDSGDRPKQTKPDETGSDYYRRRNAGEQQARKEKGPNDAALQAQQTDEGQGSAGIQGQYAGTHDRRPDTETAPRRPDPDTMNLPGSSNVALGKRKPNENK